MTNHWNTELEIIALGKRCIADITGDPGDAGGDVSVRTALKAIEECLRLGKEAVTEANSLRMQAARARDDFIRG